MMITCIAGCQYLPSVVYFAHWRRHGVITLERHEHYQKRSWRNRTAILGPDTPLVLTVPLQKGKHQQMPIQEVKIAYDMPWQKAHLHSIRTAYGKTAFFEEVVAVAEPLFSRRYETLWELNIAGLDAMTSLLPGKWKYEWTDDYSKVYPPGVSDLRRGIRAGSAPEYIEELSTYQQIHRFSRPHQPCLSILDALCHLGPGTITYLDAFF